MLKTSDGRRLRRRNGNNCSQHTDTQVIINDKGLGAPYASFFFDSKTMPPPKGAKVRLSTRWIENYSHECESEFSFPYIGVSGVQSTKELFRWNVHPAVHFISLVSTTTHRWFSILKKRFGVRYASSIIPILVSGATLHYLRSDTWVANRLLGILRRKQHQLVKRILNSMVAKLSDSQRFVYSQVCHQTHWLTHQAERPRDKLSKNDNSHIPKMFFGNEDCCQCQNFDCLYQCISHVGDPWIYRPISFGLAQAFEPVELAF